MNLLLDTHAALWWWENSPSLGAQAAAAMADGGNSVYFSAISGYEMLQKRRLGKLELPDELVFHLARCVAQEGWEPLPIDVSHATRAASFDHLHRDPFDRILAAQALSAKMTLVTTDRVFVELGVPTLW